MHFSMATVESAPEARRGAGQRLPNEYQGPQGPPRSSPLFLGARELPVRPEVLWHVARYSQVSRGPVLLTRYLIRYLCQPWLSGSFSSSPWPVGRPGAPVPSRYWLYS